MKYDLYSSTINTKINDEIENFTKKDIEKMKNGEIIRYIGIDYWLEEAIDYDNGLSL